MTRPARHPTPPFSLGPTDIPILDAFARYFYLTAAQVTRLRYAPTSHTYSQARLKTLADNGYLQRLFLPRPSRTGSAPLVYTLARKGLNTLRDAGREIERRYRPAEARELSYMHLAHTLALNDALIALELLARREAAFEIAELRHERILKLDPVHVQLADGSRVGVIPDAWLDLRIAGRYQECYALELDRGTTEQKAWRRKVAALLAYADGPYQDAFGTEAITIAVIATPGEARRQELVRWTEAELTEHGRTGQGELFRFTDLPAGETDPATFYQSAGWWIPFAPKPTGLLDLSLEVDSP